jgi:hypothetical protein
MTYLYTALVKHNGKWIEFAIGATDKQEARETLELNLDDCYMDNAQVLGIKKPLSEVIQIAELDAILTKSCQRMLLASYGLDPDRSY